MTKDEALKMAIEALKEAEDIIEGKTTQGGYFYKAIQACKEALAQPNEPVAWRYRYIDKGTFYHSSTKPDADILDDMRKEYPQFYIEPLYTTQLSVDCTKNYHLEWCSSNVKIAELTAKCEKMRDKVNELHCYLNEFNFDINTQSYYVVKHGINICEQILALEGVK